MPNILEGGVKTYDVDSNSLHDIGVTNNAVIQDKLDQSTAEIAKMN